MAGKNEVVFEREQRLSESMLWQAQRAYYDEQGVEAWTGAVPFYITSNPYIASCYARLVIRFIQSWVQKKAYCQDQPFYILEIGAGTGQFSFYMLRELMRYRKLLNFCACFETKFDLIVGGRNIEVTYS